MQCRKCNKRPIAILGRCEQCYNEVKRVRLEDLSEDVRKAIETAMEDGGDVPI